MKHAKIYDRQILV